MREKTCCFIGHRDCSALSPEQVRLGLEKAIGHGVTHFLCGGMGDFDWLCAEQVHALKRLHPQIHSTLVLPYRHLHIAQPQYFDRIYFPAELQQYDYKAAIPARNRYMVHRAAYALCYVTHDWGGAAKTYRYARQRRLRILNLGVMNPV